MGEPLYVDESSLKTIRVLGKGYFGSVSLEEHPGHGFYAKKTSSMDLKEVLEKELRIMLNFRNHPRIVQASSDRVHHTGGTTTTDPEGCCYMYMEYASQGTLSKIISSFNKKPLPEHMIQSAARMILQGLDALHSQGYVHCNLTPSNVLVFPSKTPGEPWDLKLTDLGSSKEPNMVPDSFNRCTAQYTSVESFVYWPKGKILPCYDIYSLGCVVYKMFGGKPYQEFLEEYYEWMLFEEISPVAKDFLRQCHCVKYQVRATAAELLNHPFITQRITVPLPLPLPTTQEEDKMICQDFKIPSGEDNARDMEDLNC